MSFPPLPTPSLTDPPNVPSDLGKVALAAESQAIAQYAGYNTANSPSATSIETRTSAIDGASGTVAGVEATSAALTSAVYTWTGSATSNLAAQSARTAAFPARQTGHDTLINTLNGQLATYEPQITSLINTRPAGLLLNATGHLNVPVGNATLPFVTWHTLTPRAGTIYYRVSFTGTFTFTGSAPRQTFNLNWIVTNGTTPQTGGPLAGTSGLAGANNFPYLPIACYGVIKITGDGSPWTFALFADLGGPDQDRGGAVVGICAWSIEDLGALF